MKNIIKNFVKKIKNNKIALYSIRLEIEKKETEAGCPLKECMDKKEGEK